MENTTIKMAAISPETYAECVEKIVIPAIDDLEFEYECICDEDDDDDCLEAVLDALVFNLAIRLTQDGKIVTMTGLIELDEFIALIEKEGLGECGVCCICGGHYVFGGVDPDPICTGEDDRCCHYCDRTVVTQAMFESFARSVASGEQPVTASSVMERYNAIAATPTSDKE